MKDIFEKDLSGEMVSSDEPGYDALIDDILAQWKQHRNFPLSAFVIRSVCMNLWVEFSERICRKTRLYFHLFI